MSNTNSSSEIDPNRKSKHKRLRSREYVLRNSLLTNLMESSNHCKSIKHGLIAAMILIVIQTIISDIAESGRLKFGFHYIFVGFRDFPKAILIWIIMFFASLLLHPAIRFWAQIRLKFPPKSVIMWDRFCLVLFFIYFALFFYLPVYYTLQYDLIIASSSTVIAEQIRMLMKIHAYIRSNVPRVIFSKEASNGFLEKSTFSKYVYFLFIPAFIYKDEYPRTTEIKWSFVATNFLNMFAYIYLCSSITANSLENVKLENLNWTTIALSMFSMIPPAFVLFLLFFYVFLHSWLNAWAELLRFGDRMFYQDWWNSTSHAEFYRKFNIVVHDYLYTYIYRDLYEIVLPGNKIFATCGVIAISAMMHEYLIILGFGLYLPVNLIVFGSFGLVFIFVKFKNQAWGNIFFWCSLMFGLGLEVFLYTIEYHRSRNNTNLLLYNQ